MARGAPPLHDLVAHVRLIVLPIVWVLFKIVVFFLLFLVLLMEEHATSHSPRALLRVALVEGALHLFLDELVLFVLVSGRGLQLQLKWRTRNSAIVAISDVVISLLGVWGFRDALLELTAVEHLPGVIQLPYYGVLGHLNQTLVAELLLELA